MSILETIALLIVGHCLADYPLQGTWIATTKNHKEPHPSGYPWQQSLLAHSIIHGGFVGVITGSLALGICEAIAHAAIDYSKSAGFFGKGKTSVHIDQGLHVCCKLIWGAFL